MSTYKLLATACGLAALCGCADMSPRMEEPAMTVAPRGDNPNLPNPVTPSGVNESAPQPQGTLRDPTNSTGMPGAR